jgi:signal transduction histidine kinase
MSAEKHNGSSFRHDELQPALDLALELEHATMGVLMLLDRATGELKPILRSGLTDEQLSQFGPVHPDTRAALRAAIAGKGRYTAHARKNGNAGALEESVSALGAKRMELFPLRRDGHVLGALAVMLDHSAKSSERAAKQVECCAGVLSMVLDIARLHEEADLARRQAEAMASSRMQLLAQSSHELRTPLQSITGYIELLRLGVPDKLTKEQERMLERVESSEKLLLAIIDDLITIAKLETGRVTYELGPTSLSDVVQEVESVIGSLADRRGVKLLIEQPRSDLVALADGRKLQQILINLLGNAVRILPTGGCVSLKAKREGGRIRIDVEDDGPGIDPAKLDSVFQPFVQLAASPEVRGSGLGLTISRELTSGMGAELTAKSEPGQGAVFSLHMKASQPTQIISQLDQQQATL